MPRRGWGKRWTHLPGEAPAGARRVGGRYVHSTQGRAEDLGTTWFRSKSERNYARFLRFLGIPYAYEPTTFVFEKIRSGIRTYKPDFYLPSSGEYHEVKLWLDKRSAIQLKRMRIHHPQVKVVVIGREFFQDICAKHLCRAIAHYECPHNRGRT
jgi:hypothetical protein